MKTLVLSIAVVALSAISTSLYAAEPLDGIAAVINDRIIAVAEVRAISAEAEARGTRELSGDELRKEIAKLRLSATEKLARQER